MMNIRVSAWCWPVLLLVLSSCVPSVVQASPALVQDTDINFASGTGDRVQICGTGSAAVLKLNFQWQALSPAGAPDARSYAPLACDAESQCLVLFGGYGAGRALDDTWVFTPASQSWARRYPMEKPSGRYGHGMTALQAHRILLFGGRDYGSACTNETWVYDTAANTWSAYTLSLATAPSARSEAAMATDASRGLAVLFGGREQDDTRCADTWAFDVAQGTWSLRTPVPAPSARYGAAMTYNAADNKLYLFGGNDGGLSRELWSYDPGTNTWTLCANTGPSPRTDAVLWYDTVAQKLVVYGGRDASGACDDLWQYTGTGWVTRIPTNPPAARWGHGMAFVAGEAKALLFGGYAGEQTQDTAWFYYRSTGSWVSPVLNAQSFTTSLQWKTLHAVAGVPASTAIRFQVRTSPDGTTWGPFLGYDGSQDIADAYSGVGPHTLWTGHAGQRYLQYRAAMDSQLYFETPVIDSMTVTYNRGPAAPALAGPLHGASTGQVLPVFSWNAASDQDGDILTYRIEIGTAPVFTLPAVSAADIAAGGALTTYVSTTALTHGAWYWRVRAHDGMVFGSASDPAWLLLVDTGAPAAVADAAACTGAANGSIDLTLTSPGDDGLSGALNGAYQVRFATYGPITDEVFSSLAGSEQQGLFISTGAGVLHHISVGGLAAGTSYYLAVKIRDAAGNSSALSNTAGPALTNAAPVVTLQAPAGGETWTGTQEIRWTSTDQNPGDTRTFVVQASSDAGVSYDSTVAAGLPQGTTFYSWDTRSVRNGISYRIRVRATDERGLSGDGAVNADVSISNPNEAPQVTLVYPSSSVVARGTLLVRWHIADPNGDDTHASTVSISSTAGQTYFWQQTVATDSCAVNTAQFPNGPAYRIRVVVADQYGAVASTVSSVLSMDNGNQPPRQFSLISPRSGSSRSVFDFSFSWENTGDPNPEDRVTYSVWYSTSADFSAAAVVSGIDATAYDVAPGMLQQDRCYYWRVVARDPLGQETASRETGWAFTLSRSAAESADGKLRAAVTAGLPADGFIRIAVIDGAADATVQAAARDADTDRHICLLDGQIYRIAICRADGSEMPVPDPVIQVELFYPATTPRAAYNGSVVEARNLRCAVLDESHARWLLVPEFPSLRSGSIAATLHACGTVTLAGGTVPTEMLSSLTNYPNPFAAGKQDTRIRYVLTQNTATTVRIYTLAGDLVWEHTCAAGSEGGAGQATGYTNDVRWNGKNAAGVTVANGMYLVEVRAGGERKIRKIGVVK